jgi:hypothetical protein
MGLRQLFEEPAHARERVELPLLRALVERYAAERPFLGRSVVFGHLLVRNSMIVLEALWRGGAVVQPERWPPGVHALPAEMDAWVVRSWRTAWPGVN